MTTVTPVTPEVLGEALDAVRLKAPLVQCLTNVVVAGWTANVLLAAGAAPAMVDNPREAGLFAGVADAVLVNVGTPYAETVAAMRAAVTSAGAAGTPWVLDPVAVGGLPWRTEVALALLQESPTVIRGNASEVRALTGGAGGRGVETSESPEAVLDAARDLAARLGLVVAISGPVDHITDGERVVRVANGHLWLTKVTGTGCALGALTAAFVAVNGDALIAASAATAMLTVAAETAAARTSGPGSFAVALLDDLHNLAADDLVARVRLG